MKTNLFETRTREDLDTMKAAGTLKRLRHVTGPMGATVQLEGEDECVVLC